MRGLYSWLLGAMLVLATGQGMADELDDDPRLEQPRQIRPVPTLTESIYVVRYELWGISALITGIGLKNWDWGSAKDFHTNNEGWFGKNTGSGGVDKLGHGYVAYVISEALRYQMLHSEYYYDRQTAALHAAVFSTAMMSYIEIFDGYADDHGFAKEDMIANMTGIGFSYLRGIYPKLADVLDYRLQYWPSGHDGINMFGDYEGQNFRLVLKPAGFDFMRHSNLRFLEFHLGYEATGFDRSAGFTRDDRRREVFFGLGLNFDEVFFKPRRKKAGRFEIFASNYLKYVQPEWTTLDAKIWED